MNFAVPVVRILAPLAALGLAASAAAQQAEAPVRYDLFHPKPAEKLREMSTNRPDRTESPYTVDAGHVQVEASFVDWTRDQPNNSVERTTSRRIAPVLFILGLLDNVDLEIGLEPNVRERVENREEGTTTTGSGLGDMAVGVKVNLWGNDGGETAFAVLPVVKIPTAAEAVGNDHVEGAILFPFKVTLPAEFDLGLMAEFDVLRDRANTRYVGDFLHSAALGREIVGPLGGFVEYVGQQRLSGTERYRATLNLGLTYGVLENVQLDGAVGVGLNDAADDLRLLAGISVRR